MFVRAEKASLTSRMQLQYAEAFDWVMGTPERRNLNRIDWEELAKADTMLFALFDESTDSYVCFAFTERDTDGAVSICGLVARPGARGRGHAVSLIAGTMLIHSIAQPTAFKSTVRIYRDGQINKAAANTFQTCGFQKDGDPVLITILNDAKQGHLRESDNGDGTFWTQPFKAGPETISLLARRFGQCHIVLEAA